MNDKTPTDSRGPGRPPMTALERIVEAMGRAVRDPETECWEWLGDKDSSGYGMIVRYRNGQRYRVVAHRLFLEHRLGRHLFQGAYACHHCDNPSCINPAHLFEGTASDNVRDMIRKGRCKKARLSRAQVFEIAELLRHGMTHVEIAKRFSVSVNTVGRINRGESLVYSREAS